MTFGQGTPVRCVLQPQPLAGRSRCAQFREPVSEKGLSPTSCTHPL